jgi:hypothetical protein
MCKVVSFVVRCEQECFCNFIGKIIKSEKFLVLQFCNEKLIESFNNGQNFKFVFRAPFILDR